MQVITVNACPCCGGEKFVLHNFKNDRAIDAFRQLSKRKYAGFMDGWEDQLSLDIAECSCCGHLWHHTRPDQQTLFGMYAQGRRLKGGTASTHPTSRMNSTMRGLFKICRGKKLLDYGSGAGRWSSAAQRAGFEVVAYEPASGRQGLTEVVETVDSLSAIQERRFDAINLEQVLEHVPDPASILDEIRQFSHSETVVRIAVPDVGLSRRNLWDDFPFNGETMHILSPFEHLHGYCEQSFNTLLTRVGLRPCAITTLLFSCPHYAIKKYAARFGVPYGRTMILARFI